MSPLEINTKIAEIKGLKIMLSPKDQNGLYVEAKIGGTIPYLKTTNWAENISDAWELFEEMPESTFIFRKKKRLSDCKDLFWICGLEGSIIDTMPHEITAPLAICKAWLKWKGVEI